MCVVCVCEKREGSGSHVCFPSQVTSHCALDDITPCARRPAITGVGLQVLGRVVSSRQAGSESHVWGRDPPYSWLEDGRLGVDGEAKEWVVVLEG